MALKAGATLTFTAYAVEDGGITLRFLCADPGGGEPSDYGIVLTDADLATVSTALQFRTLVQNRLQRKFRAAGIASRLDPLIGQSVTI